METTFVSTYDWLMMEGEKRGEEKTTLSVAEKLLRRFPSMTSKAVSDVSGLPLETVLKIRRRLAKEKKEAAKSTQKKRLVTRQN